MRRKPFDEMTAEELEDVMWTTCRECGEPEDLNELHFFVDGYCDCTSSCDHGLCDSCKSKV